MNNMGRPLISLGSQKNERFKKQPKQSQSTNHPQEYNDVSRSRKHNQSSIQIAANSIISDNNNRPSLVGASGQGLPPRVQDLQRRQQTEVQSINMQFSSGGGQQIQFNTEGDSISHSIEESGQFSGEMKIDKNTDDYIVDMKKGNSNILVGVRCRPLSIKEKQKQSQKSVKILDEKIIILQDVSASKPEEAFRLARPKEKTYAFDYAFDEDCVQQYVFERTTKFLIDGIMQGYNASVFAYGATGAGKTYTMLGTEEQPGIMMLSIDELFNSIERYQYERDYKLKISYVEVYNENIKDLLTDRSEYLDLREDAVKGVCVAGVNEIMTTNVDEIMRYIRQGNRQRTKERTDANEASSRSHAVLQITVEHKDKAHGINAEINIAKLSLIDLAGSERASNTNNRGIRLVEGANINKSLLALGNCINALCEQTKMGPIAAKNQHIPYRDSKLTRLLKDSLGGNCRTVMIANISPAFTAYEDTLNTLKYADRAKQIKTIVKRNVLNVEFHISNYTKIINQLRDEIVNLRSQLQNTNNTIGPVGNKNSMHSPPISNSHLNSLQLQSQTKSVGNQSAQNKLKSMKIEMNMQFEKEVMIKKDIYELDMKNEDLAFKLFSRQLNFTKANNKHNQLTNDPAQQAAISSEITSLKQEIEQNTLQKTQLNLKLQQLENMRTKMLEEYQQEMLQYEIEAIDVLYNQHLLNLKQIDIKRKENRAEFHIKQRDNYIQHLKEQLSLRDRIIKDKLGLSVTNFMPGGGGSLQQQQNSQHHSSDIATEILSMQDIDRMSRELILPSLNMTKSSSFIPNQSPLDNQNIIRGGKIDISDSPYSHGFTTSNVNSSPNQRAASHTINKNKVLGLKTGANSALKYEDGTSSSAYSNQLKLNSNNAGLSSSSNYPSYHNPQTDKKHKQSNLLDKKSINKGLNEMLNYESDSTNQNINISFQSHRNNSNSRIGMGVANVALYNSNQLQNQLLSQQNNNSLPPPSTSGGESTSSQTQAKSFANEMTKNKQKYLMMQKQHQEIFGVNRSTGANNTRTIPKNPLSINKKLSLLKKNNLNTNASGDEQYQSSRNTNPQQQRVAADSQTRIGGGTSQLIQNSGSQIANFTLKRQSEVVGVSGQIGQNNLSFNGQQLYGGNSSNANNSIINIADNL